MIASRAGASLKAYYKKSSFPHMTVCRLPTSPAWISAALILPTTLLLTALTACSGGGGGGSDNGPSVPVTVSGKITFTRIGFSPVRGDGLNPGAASQAPARLVTVEALDGTVANGAVLASATTDEQGRYSFQVPGERRVKIRAKAQMVTAGGAPSWNFSVRNNTNGDALYAIDGEPFDSGTSNSTRDLNAPSGWSGTSYTGERAAAPFAILDTVYRARALILSAVGNTVFPELRLYWSPSNKATVGVFCSTSGDIGTTFYAYGAGSADNCVSGGKLPAGIYILGDFAGGIGDTDEFDQHVIAHEFGHYLEHSFSRSDSVGGDHGSDGRLDPRVAFSEGWGNAYSGMVLNDPVYRDSFLGVRLDGGFNLETVVPDPAEGTPGWFTEMSVSSALWDLFDTPADAADTVALGFPPLYATMTGVQKDTEAMTTIFSFAAGLRAGNASQAAGINAILNSRSISTSDAYANNETNAGGSLTALPVYTDIAAGQPVNVCGSGTDTSRNKLGYRRFLRLTLSAPATLSITAQGAANAGTTDSVPASDPDIYVYRRGSIEQIGDATGSSETIGPHPYDAGVHIIEVYDYELGAQPRCMTVSVSGS